jgi:hypothetical protein
VALKALKTLKVLQHAQEEIGFGGYEDFKVFRVRRGGQVAMGGYLLYIYNLIHFGKRLVVYQIALQLQSPSKAGYRYTRWTWI